MIASDVWDYTTVDVDAQNKYEMKYSTLTLATNPGLVRNLLSTFPTSPIRILSCQPAREINMKRTLDRFDPEVFRQPSSMEQRAKKVGPQLVGVYHHHTPSRAYQ